MGKARYLADLLSSGGDVNSDRFDDMPSIDWNSTTGKTKVLNKPVLLSIGTTSSTAMAGDTSILQVQTVTSLPGSPVAGTLYLVEA